MPALKVRGPTGPHALYELDDESVTVGRSAASTLVVFDPLVSRQHLAIRRDGDHWIVEDLGSRNGTRVNDQALAGTRRLVPGDEIALGSIVIGFGAHADPGSPETPLASDFLPWSSRGATNEADPVLVGESAAMRALREEIAKVAPSDVTVLVCGETGTGKDLVARLVHRLSRRRDEPFVVVNCPALPAALVEAELFGVERGVATGVERRVGRLETADGGTIFFDEMGDLDLATQAKILRFLEERSVEPLGGRKAISLDVRLVAATNRDLEDAVERGAFRRDLFHRLDAFRVIVPPLRERPEDVPLLVQHFLTKAKPGARASREALDLLQDHAFPGNVRELRHAIERALVLADGLEIRPEHLPATVRRGARAPVGGRDVLASLRARIADGGESFWSVVRDPFLRRDLSREDAMRVVNWAWSEGGRSYRGMATLLGIPAEHRRLENFLNHHDLKVQRRRAAGLPQVDPTAADFDGNGSDADDAR
jgi:transcriptional regulator with GAF, ATPase, and Fis domain